MAEKIFNTRVVNKHDLEANWNKAVNFIPLKGELIVYDVDETHSYERIKIGDGVQNVNDLPFADDALRVELEEKIAEIPQVDWNQNDEGAADYVKNRTHYVEENIIDITGLEYVVPITDGTSNSYGQVVTHNMNLPLELGQIWKMSHYYPNGNIANYVEHSVLQAEDGTLYIGYSINDVRNGKGLYCIMTNASIGSSMFIQSQRAYEISVVGVSGFYTGETVIHQLDEKYIPTATDDEIISMLTELDMLPVVTDSDGAILTDESDNILIW